MEHTFSNYANNFTGKKISSQNIQSVNSNINVVINNQNITPNTNININNNILVINKFPKEDKEPKLIEQQENLIQAIEEQGSPSKPRYDRKGIEIKHAGKHKVSFKDKVTNNRFAEFHNIESYKEYNQMEPISTSNHQTNSCCSFM